MRETWNCMLNLFAKVVHRRLLRLRRERPHDRRAYQRDEVAPFHLIKLHGVPCHQGQVAGYRISRGQTAGGEMIL